MGITGKVEQVLRSGVARSPLLSRLLRVRLSHEAEMKKRFPGIGGLPQVSLQDLAASDRLVVEPFAFLEGGSLPTDLALLRRLAEKQGAATYFEIGTWRGESVANVAAVTESCYTLSLSPAELRALGVNENFVAVHGFFSKKLPNVTHLEGNSTTFDFSPYRGRMDLVFVDGDHSFEGVRRDTETAFTLLRDGSSVIVWHDYNADGPESVRWEVYRGIWEGTPPEKRKHLYKVSNTLCAIWYPHEIHSSHRDFPQMPEVEFRVDISLSPARGSASGQPGEP